MKRFVFIFAALLLTACAPDNPDNHMDGDGIVISSATIRPPLPGKTITAGYLTFKNHGPDDRLVGAESDMAGRVELHTHINEDGIMKMRRVEGVDLPSGKTVTFMPGSYHLMMFDVTLTDQHRDASVTLKFQNAPDLTVIAEISDPVLDGPIKHDGH